MSSDTDKNVNDHDEIVSILRQYPSVKLLQAQGSPPDHYEIEYRLKGYILGDDDIVTTSNIHRVQINLPFGYPHFSPTCKPLTSVFHPDFDTDAIRVADFWNEDKSLSGLIIHIGTMICGISYSIVDPFNQKALEWYEEHRSDLPLDNIDGTSEIDEEDDGIDTLDDDLFASLMLADDAEKSPPSQRSLQPKPSLDSSRPKIRKTDDAELLRQAIDKKKIFEAQRLLSRLSHDTTLPGRSEIQQSIVEVIDKAKEHHREACKFEKLGKLDQAKISFEKVAKLITDFPGLEEDFQRIDQSLELISGLEEPIQTQAKTHQGPTNLQKNSGISGVRHQPKSPIKKRITFSKKTKLYILGGLCTSGLICGGLFYIGPTNTRLLVRAETNIEEAQTLIDQQEYKQAKDKLETVKNSLGSIWLHKSEKSAIRQKMETLLSSRELAEGLAGNVKYAGKFIPADRVAILNEITAKTDQAADLAKINNWKAATNLYKEALTLASKADLAEIKQEIERDFAELKLKHSLFAGKEAEFEKKWLIAAKHYQQAFRIAKSQSEEIEQIEIAGRLAEVKFHHLFEQGKQAFGDSEWQQAINFIQQAQKIIVSSPTGLTDRKKALLAKNLFQVKLYQVRAKAIQEFNAANWEMAIKLYDKALVMLKKNDNLLDQSVIEQSRNNIKHSQLLASIAQDRGQAMVASHNSDNDSALQYYNHIITLLNKSKVKKDSELQSIRLETESKILNLKEQIFLDSKTSYLTDNYRKFIRDNYPNANPAKLESPKATLLKKNGRDLIFELSCIERSRSRNFRLILNYRYSPTTNSWSLYDE